MNSGKLFTIEKFRPARPAPAPTNDHAAHDAEPIQIHRFVDLKKQLKPLDYAIDRIVPKGRILTLTGPTHVGKTAFCTIAALAVVSGRSDILDIAVEKGRVVYLAIENSDDTVARFAIAQRVYRIPDLTLGRLFIIRDKVTPEAVLVALDEFAQKSGEIALVIVDTLAAYFDGADLNNNVEGGNFMRRLRALSTVLGNPAVLVSAHPVKGATEASLIPYGGGAIVNEVDGNLTLWRVGNAVKLHWQRKFRGPNFAPRLFQFKKYGCDTVLDAKGRRVIMPLLLPYMEESAKPLPLPAPARLHRSDDANLDTRLLDAKLLRAMIADPKGTQEQWAAATDVVKSNVNRRLMRLKAEGLVHAVNGRWAVTPAGKAKV